MIAPARLAAYDVLRAISGGRQDLASALAHARSGLRDDRDRALASEIASGVLRWQGTLDHCLAHFARRAADRLDPEVRLILRIAAYQLLHLTRVPASAVVDDAVSMTRRVRKSSASGFVNGVLRALSRGRNDLPLPVRPDGADRAQAIDYLSGALAHPRWLAARWHDRLGFERAETWMRFNNQAPPLTLRANRVTTTPEALRADLEQLDVVVEPGAYAPDALRVSMGAALRTADVATDRYVVQDEGSQLVALLAGARPGRRVLDACASPGGKTTAMAAAAAGSDTLIVACDVRDRRMALLRATVAATRVSRVVCVQADLMAPLPFGAVFDTVIVDAPCSGLGTLRRDPDIKWHRQEQDLPALAAAQAQMLRHAATVVAPGGRLIYATCSTEPDENERIVDAFLAEGGQFEPLDARQVDDRLAPVTDDRGHLRTTPDQHGLEGFFGAVVVRSRV